MIERKIFSKLKKLYAKPDIMALIGARRVGKTTLMEQLYEEEKKQKVFLSFDDQKILSLFIESIDEFAEIYIKPNDVIFIDEFQYAKEGGKKLKYLYDKYKKKIIISGSSSSDLTIQSLSYLVGRVFIINIHPISFDEFLNYKNPKLLPLLKKVTKESYNLIKPLFEEYIIYGGYPQVILEKSKEEKKERLNQIVNTYLLKEIRDILQYKDSNNFLKLLKMLALESGGMINKNKVSSLLDIPYKKLTEMIDVLEKTFVLRKVSPFTSKKIKQLVKTPKTYFLDNGFRNSLINDFRPLDERIDKSVLFENFLLHAFYSYEQKPVFFNHKNNGEIDFLLIKNNDIFAIEAKSKLSKPQIERGMQEFIKKFNPVEVLVFNETIFSKHKIKNKLIYFKHYIEIFDYLKKG